MTPRGGEDWPEPVFRGVFPGGRARGALRLFSGRFVSVMQTQQPEHVSVAAEVIRAKLHFWIEDTRLYQTWAEFGYSHILFPTGTTALPQSGR